MKIGVVLSGSGFKDGSEIREAVLTLLAISKLGAEALCIAPDVMQTDVTNNLSGKPANEKRNVLVESARIARGQIKSTKEVNPNEIDALIFPGGYGVAKNLSTFAKDGAGCRVEPSVEVLTKRIHEQGKPLVLFVSLLQWLQKFLKVKESRLRLATIRQQRSKLSRWDRDMK